MTNTQKTESTIMQEEKKVIAEVKKDFWLLGGGIALVILAFIWGGIYLTVSKNQIYIENSSVSAPSVALTSKAGGVLQEVYVHEGDVLVPNTVVARVGTELIKTLSAAQVISVQNNIGANVTPGQAVVTVIDPSELRIVGKIDEDKGLSDVRVGQRVLFTVDTFGSQQFEGVVDEISPTSRAGDIVFNISDKREQQQFNIKVRFDVVKYSELRNGMSAKITIFKD